MEKTEIMFQERRQKPQGYHCPACGTVGMIMMAGMFAVTVIEGMCDSLIEKISEL